MYWQINEMGGRACAAKDKPTCSSGLCWLSGLSDLFLKHLDPLSLVIGGSEPQAAVDLGLLASGPSSFGVGIQLLADSAYHSLGPCWVSQCLHGYTCGPLAQFVVVLRLSHGSGPSVSSLSPSNPGRFNEPLIHAMKARK